MAKEKSVLDRLKEIDAEREKLLSDAKEQALKKAQEAVEELNGLGFQYRLIDGPTPTAPRAPRASTGTRRTGMRDQLINLIKGKPDGMGRAQILEAMNAKGNKSAEQSISNALANLKKANTVTLTDGIYKVAA